MSYNEIVAPQEQFNIISGRPGSGKTTLCETLAYQWACDKLWTENPNFQFVFLLKFRKLNDFNDKEVSAKKILSYFHPNYFDRTLQLHGNSLLIIDGFDECSAKEELTNQTEDEYSSFARALYDLIDPNNQDIASVRIITGRPESCSDLIRLSATSFQSKYRLFEITGFNLENIQRYVSQYWETHLKQDGEGSRIPPQEGMLERFLAMINETPILRSMMTVPFYSTTTYHLTLESDISLDSIFSIRYTSLFSRLLILYIRNHGLRNPKLIGMEKVLRNENTKPIILMLGKFAFNMEEKNKIAFTESDIAESVTESDIVKKSGFIIKIEAVDEEEPSYQFFHYSFHEFLVAVHAFHTGSTGNIKSPGIKAMIAGFIGGLQNDSPSDWLVKRLAEMLKPTGPNKIDIEDLLWANEFNFFASVMFEYQHNIHLKKQTFITLEQKIFSEHYAENFLKHLQENKLILESAALDLSMTSLPKEILVGLRRSTKLLILYVKEKLKEWKECDDYDDLLADYNDTISDRLDLPHDIHFDKVVIIGSSIHSNPTRILYNSSLYSNHTNAIQYIAHKRCDSGVSRMLTVQGKEIDFTFFIRMSDFETLQGRTGWEDDLEKYCDQFKTFTIAFFQEHDQDESCDTPQSYHPEPHTHCKNTSCIKPEFNDHAKQIADRYRHSNKKNLYFATSCLVGGYHTKNLYLNSI